jgi:hypothetical protein
MPVPTASCTASFQPRQDTRPRQDKTRQNTKHKDDEITNIFGCTGDASCACELCASYKEDNDDDDDGNDDDDDEDDDDKDGACVSRVQYEDDDDDADSSDDSDDDDSVMKVRIPRTMTMRMMKVMIPRMKNRERVGVSRMREFECSQ